jgi:hypothetical protein
VRQLGNLASAVAALAVLGGCSADSVPETEPSPEASASTASGLPESEYTFVAETMLQGPGRWAMRAPGDHRAALAVIDVPAGYLGRETWVWTHDDLGLDVNSGQVLYRAPTRVPSDPCDADGRSQRLGSSVEDLAEALVAQQRTTTTRPVPSSLDGYRGLYLELRTPAGFDLTGCGPDGFVVYEAGEEVRPHEWPIIDRCWILDVEGRRVMMTASTPAGAGRESVARVADVVEAVTFVQPGF